MHYGLYQLEEDGAGQELGWGPPAGAAATSPGRSAVASRPLQRGLVHSWRATGPRRSMLLAPDVELTVRLGGLERARTTTMDLDEAAEPTRRHLGARLLLDRYHHLAEGSADPAGR